MEHQVAKDHEAQAVLRQERISALASTVKASPTPPLQPLSPPPLYLPSTRLAAKGESAQVGMEEARPQDVPTDVEEPTEEDPAMNAFLSWRAEGFSSPSGQLSMPKPSHSRRASKDLSDDPITRAPPALVPGPSKQSSSNPQVNPQAQALQEVHWLMSNGREEGRRTALQTLATLSSAENLPAGLLAETMRTAKGCVEFLCSMLTNSAQVEAALVALGNFGIEANEADMLRIGSAGGIEQIFRIVAKPTTDDALLTVALGACMNVCNGFESARLACEMGLFVRLHELTASVDLTIRHFASSALSNIQASIIECVRSETLIESDHLSAEEMGSPQLAAFYESVSSYFKRRRARSALVHWAHAAAWLREGSEHGDEASHHRQRNQAATPPPYLNPASTAPRSGRGRRFGVDDIHLEGPSLAGRRPRWHSVDDVHPEGRGLAPGRRPRWHSVDDVVEARHAIHQSHAKSPNSPQSTGGTAKHGLRPRRLDLPLHGPARDMAMQLPIDNMDWLSSRWAVHKRLTRAWSSWRRVEDLLAVSASHASFVRQGYKRGIAAWRSLMARRQVAKRALSSADVTLSGLRCRRAVIRLAARRARATEVESAWLQAMTACNSRLCRRAVGWWHQRHRERVDHDGRAVQMEVLVTRHTASRTQHALTRWRAAYAALQAGEQRKVDRVYRRLNFHGVVTRWASQAAQAATELASSERAAQQMARRFKHTALGSWMQQVLQHKRVAQQMAPRFKGSAFMQWVRWAQLVLVMMDEARRITGRIAQLVQHHAWSQWVSYLEHRLACTRFASARANHQQTTGFTQWFACWTNRNAEAGLVYSAEGFVRQRGLTQAVCQWKLFHRAHLSTRKTISELEVPSTVTRRRILALWSSRATQRVDDHRAAAMCYRRQGLRRALRAWAAFRCARLTTTHTIVSQLEEPSTITRRCALVLWFRRTTQWVDDHRAAAICYRRQGLTRVMDLWVERAAADHAGAARTQSASQWEMHKGLACAWIRWRRKAHLSAAPHACFVWQGHQRGMAAWVAAGVRRGQPKGLTRRAAAHWATRASIRKQRRMLALWSGLMLQERSHLWSGLALWKRSYQGHAGRQAAVAHMNQRATMLSKLLHTHCYMNAMARWKTFAATAKAGKEKSASAALAMRTSIVNEQTRCKSPTESDAMGQPGRVPCLLPPLPPAPSLPPLSLMPTAPSTPPPSLLPPLPPNVPPVLSPLSLLLPPTPASPLPPSPLPSLPPAPSPLLSSPSSSPSLSRLQHVTLSPSFLSVSRIRPRSTSEEGLNRIVQHQARSPLGELLAVSPSTEVPCGAPSGVPYRKHS